MHVRLALRAAFCLLKTRIPRFTADGMAGARAAGSGGSDDFAEVPVREAYDGVGAPVVHGHAIGGSIHKRRARKDNVRDVAYLLVRNPWGQEVVVPTRDDLPGFFQIQQRRPHRIHKSITRCEHAVIDEQPAVFSLDRNGTGPDLGRFPRPWARSHHVSVAAPVD